MAIKQILMLPLLCFVGFSALAEDSIKGLFSCVVLGTSVTSVEEGKEKRSSRYQGGVRKGETISISYELQPKNYGKHNMQFYVDGLNTQFVRGSGGAVKVRDDYKKKHYPNFIFSENLLFNFSYDDMYIDFIRGDIHLKRYYKRDWQGLIVANYGGFSAFVASLDCRNKVDKIDDIVDKLQAEGY